MKAAKIYIGDRSEDGTGFSTNVTADTSTSNVKSLYLHKEIMLPTNVAKDERENGKEDLNKKLGFYE